MLGLEIGGAWKTDPKRRLIPLRVKRIVYERAEGKCQKCKTHLKIDEGDFHHKGKPTSTSARAIL
jgi:5-methylcytosine-specific restriction endonuclease McrA